MLQELFEEAALSRVVYIERKGIRNSEDWVVTISSSLQIHLERASFQEDQSGRESIDEQR